MMIVGSGDTGQVAKLDETFLDPFKCVLPSAPATEDQPRRKPLPDHLPREDAIVDVDGLVCPCCGGALHAIGENVSEMLDWVPAQLKAIRRSRLAARTTCSPAAMAGANAGR